jgi:hypothetical protein
LGWTASDQLLTDFSVWGQSNPRPKNQYNMADYGIDAAELSTEFEFYTRRFFAKNEASEELRPARRPGAGIA